MKIGVIGLGYVGLPRCLQFLKKGFNVYGFDTDISKIKILKNGKSYLTNVNKNEIKNYINKKFFVYNSFENIEKLDFIVICLPTPLKNNSKPDLSIISNVFKKIEKFLRFKQCICLESTTYPGSTEELFLPILRKKFNLGKNFYLVYSPERNDPGLKINIHEIPKIVSGYSEACKKKGVYLYSKIFKKLIPSSNMKTAEMTKLYENIFRAVNISLVNETRIILNKFNIDINEVINAASSKPFGFMPFYPGPGFGGHCIPVDPYYFVWSAKQKGIDANFIKLSGNINRKLPKWIISQINKILKQKGSNLFNKKILILGVSYKKNINDDRESPSYNFIKELINKFKCKIQYSDPFIKKINLKNMKRHLTFQSVKITQKNLSNFDYIILITDHDKFDYNVIKKFKGLIFDTRNKLKKQKNIIHI